jgi:hypothetical protein
MRKSRLDSSSEKPKPTAAWLNLDKVAAVAVTSEDPQCPIESALTPGESSGWRAGSGGEQTIRLIFDLPQRIQRIWLRFVETQTERTQEFSLQWRPDKNGASREIVRQQWNFSPQGTTTEIEDYQVNLDKVGILELKINPDISRGDSVASLAEWRVA